MVGPTYGPVWGTGGGRLLTPTQAALLACRLAASEGLASRGATSISAASPSLEGRFLGSQGARHAGLGTGVTGHAVKAL